MAKARKVSGQQEKKRSTEQKAQQEVRKICIPTKIAKYAASVFCLLIIVLMVTVIEYRQAVSTAQSDNAELLILRQQNKDQLQEIEQLSKATAGLQKDMERLNALELELRHIVNNDEVTVTSRAGLVRMPMSQQSQSTFNSDPKKIEEIVIQLQENVKVREESLLQLKEALLAKQMKMAAKPSIWPTVGEVTSRFGWRNSPTGSSSDYHPGIDIANSIGTPIVATADGVVIQSEWFAGYGETVQIDHGNGITTLYGHNSQRVVQLGEKVKKGQLISYLGSTGYSTGPHVHYEVRINGTAVNPANFLKE